MLKNEYLVRLGRVIWWGAITFVVTLCGIIFLRTIIEALFEDHRGVTDMVGVIVLIVGVLFVGRSVKYVLTNQ